MYIVLDEERQINHILEPENSARLSLTLRVQFEKACVGRLSTNPGGTSVNCIPTHRDGFLFKPCLASLTEP